MSKRVCEYVYVSGLWPKFEANSKPSKLNPESHTPEQRRFVGQGQVRPKLPRPAGNPAGVFCSQNSVSSSDKNSLSIRKRGGEEFICVKLTREPTRERTCIRARKRQKILALQPATCLTLLFSCRPPALARSSLPALHLSVGYLHSSPFHSTFQTIQEEYLVCLGEGQKLTHGRKSVKDLKTAGFIKTLELKLPKVLEDVRSQWVCASVVWCVCVCLSLSLSISLSLSLRVCDCGMR